MSQLGRAELARLSVRDYRKRSKLRSTGKHRFAGNRVEPSLLGLMREVAMSAASCALRGMGIVGAGHRLGQSQAQQATLYRQAPVRSDCVEPSLLGWGGRKRSKLRSTGKHRSAGNRVEPSLLVWGGRKRSKLRSTGKHRFAVIV
jgi:hypothetical protein